MAYSHADGIRPERPNTIENLNEELFLQTHYTQNFEEGELIGDGGFGSVFKARHMLDKQYYAIKKVCYKKEDERLIVREVQALACLNNPYIVRYFHAWRDERECRSEDMDGMKTQALKLRTGVANINNSQESTDGPCTLYIQMELCTSTLERWIMDKNKSIRTEDRDLPTKIENIFQQILIGLEHIHSKDIVHRDLKPANVFILHNEKSTAHFSIKIGDFGLCKSLKNSDSPLSTPDGSGDCIGTIPYASPECRKIQFGHTTGKESDIYSLGVIYLELCCKVNTVMELIQRVQEVQERVHLSELMYQQEFFLQKMLSILPEERPTAVDVLKALAGQCTDSEDNISTQKSF